MTKFKQITLGVFTSLVATTMLASCGKDGDSPTPSGYPKNVTIEYKVTSPDIQKLDVRYINETGGATDIDDVSLPYSKSIQKSVSQFDGITLTAHASGPGTVKTDILVNGQVVKTETFSSTSFAGGTVAYVFP